MTDLSRLDLFRYISDNFLEITLKLAGNILKTLYFSKKKKTHFFYPLMDPSFHETPAKIWAHS